MDERITYENRYGKLVLVLESEYMPIAMIRSRDVNVRSFFDIATAERIALITENRGIQIAPAYPVMHRLYVCVHSSPSTAAIARIGSIQYVGGDPAEEIERCRREDGFVTCP